MNTPICLPVLLHLGKTVIQLYLKRHDVKTTSTPGYGPVLLNAFFVTILLVIACMWDDKAAWFILLAPWIEPLWYILFNLLLSPVFMLFVLLSLVFVRTNFPDPPIVDGTVLRPADAAHELAFDVNGFTRGGGGGELSV